MRLNQASDFALRIMMLLTKEKDPLTVKEISTRLKLVKSHVMKIIARLGSAGLVSSQRGRLGGVSLARAASDISVGEVVRAIEADFAIVECMHDHDVECVFQARCKLKGVMNSARNSFLEVLDQETLESIANGVDMQSL